MLQVRPGPYTAAVTGSRPSLAAAGLAAMLGGCTAVGPSYEDPTPDARLGAIRATAEAGTRADVPRLVENLSADDAAVRMAAIGALRRITGETNGYRFDAPAAERAEAIGRWRRWVAVHGSGG